MRDLRADTYRLFGRSSPWLVWRAYWLQPSFRVVVTLRLCQAANQLSPGLRLAALLPARVLHRLACRSAGLELPWRTRMGPGLAVTHGWGLVVSEGAKVGANVTLFHGVTLGQHDRIDASGQRHTRYPVIEDEVWIGPHAIVVGGITVGRGSRIAGGALVNRDVPPHCLVLGNPGRVVKTGCVADVANPYTGEE